MKKIKTVEGSFSTLVNYISKRQTMVLKPRAKERLAQ